MGELLPDVTMSSATQKAFADAVVEQLPTGIISAGGTKVRVRVRVRVRVS